MSIKTLYIDPGHRNNAQDFGAAGHGLKESERALKIAEIVASKASRLGVRVIMSRKSENDVRTLKSRTDEANAAAADLYLSIHINAAGNDTATGIEVLHFDGSNKNQASKMSEKIAAAADMRNRGPKERQDLHVLKASKMAALLVECGFISTAADAMKLKDPLILEKMAGAIVDSLDIGQYVDEYKKAVEKLVIEGIIGSPAAWLPNPNPANVNALIAKFGRLKWGLHCAGDTIDRMAAEKMINSPQIWHDGTEHIGNIKQLVKVIAANV